MSELSLTTGDRQAEVDRKGEEIGGDVVDLLRVTKAEGSIAETSIVKTDKGRQAGVTANRHGLIRGVGSDRRWSVSERGEKVLDIASEGDTPVVKPGGDIGRK